MFVVVPAGQESLLGDQTCVRLGLVKRVHHIQKFNENSVEFIVSQYPDNFKGFGVLPFTYKIQLKEDARPVVHASWRVPAPLQDKVKQLD